ncbi:hypothetical protein [Hymenobacter cellulosivorans]|uniref:SnoaL-like domain-containing protein n=1 Tax=Hymenobacter cellulosivorans TaxID=2932249 RepID=A0ABY4F9W4_9BACT|nr:hypothetical protein [Hymenobacter cellulosivorans]UOQ52739.1 hypothetical protein MUN80_23710 [Hymenobacter cellulosivorans]
MKNWLLIGALVLLSSACQKPSDISLPDPAYYRQQETQVLVDLFNEIIAAHRMALPPLPGTQAADTIGMPLYVADSLFGKKSQWPRHHKAGTHKAVSATQRNLLMVHNDSLTETVALPGAVVALIKRQGFHVITGHRRGHVPQPAIGISLSRVIFNRDFTQACFVHSLACGEDCAEGTLLFVRKQKGRWVITQRHGLWVA